MGAWSHEPFGNDTANDWGYGLEDTQDLSLVDAALSAVVNCEEKYLDASVAEEAVAAAEVLAQLLGRGTQRDSYTKKVEAWTRTVTIRPSPELKHKARKALERILSDESELRELWQESDQASEWEDSIRALQTALED